jgi:hypothetical protein
MMKARRAAPTGAARTHGINPKSSWSTTCPITPRYESRGEYPQDHRNTGGGILRRRTLTDGHERMGCLPDPTASVGTSCRVSPALVHSLRRWLTTRSKVETEACR